MDGGGGGGPTTPSVCGDETHHEQQDKCVEGRMVTRNSHVDPKQPLTHPNELPGMLLCGRRRVWVK